MLKFTQDGKFLMQVGKKGRRPDSLARIASISSRRSCLPPKTNEAFLADGYGNKRVAVIDADTGKMKRFWGAYGNPPDDKLDLWARTPGGPLAKGFRGPVHCAEPTNDGLVYVCDRTNDRLQVFTLEGKYVNEIQAARIEGRWIDVGHGFLERSRSRSICISPTAVIRSFASTTAKWSN